MPTHPNRLSPPILAGLLGLLAAQAQIPNSLPIRIGADQTGQNAFRGEIAAVRLYSRLLATNEIAALAQTHPNTSTNLAGLVAQWRFGSPNDALLENDPALPARRSGDVTPTTAANAACAHFAGGCFTIIDDPRLAFLGGTVEAWIRPEPNVNGRIVDRITPGGSDGWLLDTYPGNSLRAIVGAQTYTHPLPHSDRWTHVALTVDPEGTAALFVNGTRVAGNSIALLDSNITLAGAAPSPDAPLTLWYRQPARRWTEALVLGNGRLGAMLWGGVSREHIDLNEDTLWSGEPYDNLNTNGLRALPTIRSLLLAGKNPEAQALVERDMNGKYNQCYMPFGALTLEFPFRGEVRDYRRQLDLDQAIAQVQFTHDGAFFTREVFASNPDQAIIVRLDCDQPGRVSFHATLDSQLEHSLKPDRSPAPTTPASQSTSTGPSTTTSSAPDILRLTGRAPIHADPHYLGKRIVYDDSPNGRGMRFEARLTATHTGGSLRFTDDGLIADRCDRVTLILVAATSYNGPHRSPSRDGIDPAQRCVTALAPIAAKPYATLRQAHLADHQRLFRRVQLDLGHSAAQAVPTDLRLLRYRPGADPSLATLYYQFGRYLLIAGSRPSTQPLNLQGIWNKDINPAWSANWTLNCNAQINYWPVEVANLAECHQPLIDLTTELSVDGTNIARNLYGAAGWVAHHNTDIWRQAGPVAGSACWSVFQVGSAWLCQHLWEHYAFSADTNQLRQLWPTLAGAAQFYLDALIPEPTHGWLVTAPDVNFENAFRKPDGASACSCYGPTASMQMVRQLFLNCLAADAILRIDPNLRARIETALPRLAPMQISPTTAELQEWVDDWQRTADCQVLSSWGAVCSAQIAPRQTPDLAAALRRIFDKANWWQAGAVGSWQGAFQANTYARLHDGDKTLAILDTHLRRVVNPNLSANFGGAAEWEIDGNLGLTAAVGEMLLQSHTGDIELLPALPTAWSDGSVRGLRARGAITVNLAWSRGQLVTADLLSAHGGPVRLRYRDQIANLTFTPGETQHWQPR
jgi:alpha-L-fucosidase 2